MSLETISSMYGGIVAGVIGGLILRLAQIISKEFNHKQEKFWVEATIALGLLILLTIYFIYKFA